jgi:hypothetical protein
MAQFNITLTEEELHCFWPPDTDLGTPGAQGRQVYPHFRT